MPTNKILWIGDSCIVILDTFWIEWVWPCVYGTFFYSGKTKALGRSKRGKWGYAYNRMCYSFGIGPLGFRYYAKIKRKKK